MDEMKLLKGLLRDLSVKQRIVNSYTAYYEGEQPLQYMVPALQEEFGDRITQLVINWPRLGADIHEERLDLEGFRFGRESEADDDLWRWWKSVDGEQQSQQANLESIICGHSYAFVSASGDAEPAELSVEHPSQVTHRVDPRTRRTSSVVKRWDDDEKVRWAEMMLPDSTILYRWDRGWVEDSRDDHDLGRVTAVPLVNRPRMLRPMGVSEFHDVIPIANAANKMATDMMISGEFHAMPRRWAFGMDEKDFVDENGRQLTPWEQVAGRMWSTPAHPDDVKVGQFDESDLTVFHNTITLLARLASHLLALPPDFMAFESSNPPSAEGQRATETRLIKRAERRQSTLSTSYQEIVRCRDLCETGSIRPEGWSLEAIWRDAATPTRAAAADAAVKLNGAGIVPLEQTREDLGYSVIQRERMREMDSDDLKRQWGMVNTGFDIKPNA